MRYFWVYPPETLLKVSPRGVTAVAATVKTSKTNPVLIGERSVSWHTEAAVNCLYKRIPPDKSPA